MPLLANSINTNFSSGFKVFQVAERLAKSADEMNAALRISKESLSLLLTHVMPHNSYISEKLTGGAPERYTAGQACRAIEGATNHIGSSFSQNTIIGILAKYRFVERLHSCTGL